MPDSTTVFKQRKETSKSLYQSCAWPEETLPLTKNSLCSTEISVGPPTAEVRASHSKQANPPGDFPSPPLLPLPERH